MVLRPSSKDFPKLVVTCRGEETRIKETERIVSEKVTRKTEEVLDEVTGKKTLRTIEYIEKTIEKEVGFFQTWQHAFSSQQERERAPAPSITFDLKCLLEDVNMFY